MNISSIIEAGARALLPEPPPVSPEILGAALMLACLLADEDPEFVFSDGQTSLVDSRTAITFATIEGGAAGPVALFAGLPPDEVSFARGVRSIHGRVARAALLHVRSLYSRGIDS